MELINSRPFSKQLRADYTPVSDRFRNKICSALSLTTQTYEVVGIDVSVWQGLMDWSIAKDKVHFAFLRAGYGNTYIDPQLSNNVLGCMDNDIPYGMYWYLKPDKNWKLQAESFANVYSGQLPPVADVEESGGLGKTELESFVVKFIGRFKELTNKDVMIYTSPNFWNTYMPRTNWAKNYLLWNAHWTTADEPILPYDWVKINNPKTWEFWQYSAKGDGSMYGAQSRNIDLNRYRYSISQFNATYGTNIKPLPGDEDPPMTEIIVHKGKVLAGALRIREQPNTTSPYHMYLLKDNTPEIMEEFKDANNNIWVRVGWKQWAAMKFSGNQWITYI